MRWRTDKNPHNRDALTSLIKHAFSVRFSYSTEKAHEDGEQISQLTGEIDMPDSKPSFADSACLSKLRAAILAEQQVLELDIYIVSARVEALLGASFCGPVTTRTPLGLISTIHGFRRLAHFPADCLVTEGISPL